MTSYVLRRILYIIPTLLGITVVTFIIVHLAPGDPVQVETRGMMSTNLTKEYLDELRAFYGLDKPLLFDLSALSEGRPLELFDSQYFTWLAKLLTFDFGRSSLDHRRVSVKILEKLPATLQLSVVSILLMYLISIPLGVWSAVRQNSLFDKLSGLILYVLYSLPSFWIALLLIILFSVKLGWLPLGGVESPDAARLPLFERLWDRLLHMILPVTAYTYGSFAFLSRFTRGSMLEVIRQDYVRTARSKGLSEGRVIFKHAFRNGLIPIVTMLGYLLPALISGSVILEYIFTWPGIGWLYFNSILARDYYTIMGLAFITAILTLVGILVSDVLYAVVDPRITYD